MRGQPDLLFWRIDTCDLDEKSKSNNYDSNNNNNNSNNNDYNNNINNNNNNEEERNTNIDIITTHTVFAVEVKSSSDQLSEWQIAWFNLLKHAGVHVEKFQVLDA